MHLIIQLHRIWRNKYAFHVKISVRIEGNRKEKVHDHFLFWPRQDYFLYLIPLSISIVFANHFSSYL